MRVLHFFKTYLPESVGGIEQVIYQLCQSGIGHGIHGEVLTLSANPQPREVMVADHKVHRAKLDIHLASTGFSYSVLTRFRELAADFDFDPSEVLFLATPATRGWAARWSRQDKV